MFSKKFFFVVNFLMMCSAPLLIVRRMSGSGGLSVRLIVQGVPRSDQLQEWVCLVEGNARTASSPNSSGPFQISGEKWCSIGDHGNGLNVKCEDLQTDDVSGNSLCALVIFDIRGLEAWNGWTKRFKEKKLPHLSHCFKP